MDQQIRRRAVYVLHPGLISSKNDGDVHFISARQLAALFEIDFNACLVMGEGTPKEYVNPGHHLHLYPQYDGNYDKEKVARLS